MSTIEDTAGTVLARRIRGEREARGWSLAGLAERAGVSKAMLSKIERVECGPTMATLFESPGDGAGRLVRARDQPLWRDPKTAYLRRQVFLSPSNPLELVEVELPAQQEVGFPASAYQLIRQVVWVLRNHLTIVEGAMRHDLAAGDRVEFDAPSDIVFRNEGALPCRYLVAVVRR
jgi:transcriptional regulator with XRE-family HTH domain